MAAQFRTLVKPLPSPLAATCLLLAACWVQGPQIYVHHLTAGGAQLTPAMECLEGHRARVTVARSAADTIPIIITSKKVYRNYTKIIQKLYNTTQYHQSKSYDTHHHDSTFSVTVM